MTILQIFTKRHAEEPAHTPSKECAELLRLARAERRKLVLEVLR